MNLTSLITDNISEVLVKIIEFTKIRREILLDNINNFRSPGFSPRDLTVDEFSGSMDNAIAEHIRSRRLLLCDTENVKFGVCGKFTAKPVVDEDAKQILEESKDEYLELQLNKLLENLLNQKVAAELMKQKKENLLFPE